jgi:Peptidase family M23
MRRQRPIHYPLAMMAVAFGVVATPSVNRAFAAADDGGTDATPPAAPEPEPQPEPQPQPEPAPEPVPEPEPEPAPEPAPEPEPTTPPPTTEPPTTEPPTTEPPTTEPPTTEPAADPDPGPEPVTPAPDVTADPEPAAPSSPDDPAPARPDDSPAARGIDGITRHISFPVLGPVRYSNDFGACRDGCARHHEGNDLLGVRMQPLLAAVDGTITRIRYENEGTAGAAISVTGADGWYYNYFHVNNDTPGTDDGAAGHQWQVKPGLMVGSHVRAGQVIGYMGDSGNSEGSVPHLHFEVRTPDHTPVNPYYSLVAAQKRETCTPDDAAWTNTALGALSPKAVAIIPLADGGQWVIDIDGRLHAEGPAARIEPLTGVDCDLVAPLIKDVAPLATAAPSDAQPAAPAPVAEPAAPVAEPEPDPESDAPAPTADRDWTVQPGESLWRIVQDAYGVSDDAATAALVDLVFDINHDQLTDPSVLTVGTTLRLPPLSF